MRYTPFGTRLVQKTYQPAAVRFLTACAGSSLDRAIHQAPAPQLSEPITEKIAEAVLQWLAWAAILAMAFAGLHVEAASEFFYFEIPYSATPPAASACGGRVITCHNNAATTKWQCYCVK